MLRKESVPPGFKDPIEQQMARVSSLPREDTAFSESKLETVLQKLIVHNTLPEALAVSGLYEIYEKSTSHPQVKGLKELQNSFPLKKDIILTGGYFPTESGMKDIVFAEVDSFPDAARMMYVLTPTETNEGLFPRVSWRVHHYFISDGNCGKTIDLLKIVPDDWDVKIDARENPHVHSVKHEIFIGPLKGIEAKNMRMDDHQLEGAVHEFGHLLKQNEENFLLSTLSPKEILAFGLGYCLYWIFPVTLPVIHSNKYYTQMKKIGASIDRKATAIGIRFIRKMRKLGVDPLPGVTNSDMLLFYHRALSTKDACMPGLPRFCRFEI